MWQQIMEAMETGTETPWFMPKQVKFQMHEEGSTMPKLQRMPTTRLVFDELGVKRKRPPTPKKHGASKIN